MKPAPATINTIQRTPYVRRMATSHFTMLDNIWPYDVDNLYPNKARAIAQRSGSLTTALGTLARFVTGQGFTDPALNLMVVNDKNETLLDLLRKSAAEFAHFGLAWHIKYNVMGTVAAVESLLFEQVRVNRDGNLVIRADWSEPFLPQNAPKVCTPFAPENIMQEFENVGGWEMHTGQVLYYHSDANIYPLARFDAILDDAQLEAEAKIYALSNIQNEFSASGVFKHPNVLTSDKDSEALRERIKDLSGAGNRGGIIAVGLNPSQMEKEFKMWEPFTITNVDGFYKTLREDAKKNIYELFQQPGIINGRSDSGMFNEASMRDAFAFYNSVTETYRQDLETIFGWVFAPLTFQIKPLDFIVRETAVPITNNTI